MSVTDWQSQRLAFHRQHVLPPRLAGYLTRTSSACEAWWSVQERHTGPARSLATVHTLPWATAPQLKWDLDNQTVQRSVNGFKIMSRGIWGSRERKSLETGKTQEHDKNLKICEEGSELFWKAAWGVVKALALESDRPEPSSLQTGWANLAVTKSLNLFLYL